MLEDQFTVPIAWKSCLGTTNMATIQRIPVSGDGTVAVPSEWFIARITSVAASQSGSGSCLGYAHGWIEQSICANGYDYEDDTEGQSS